MIEFLKVIVISQGTKNRTSCKRRSHSTCKFARTWRSLDVCDQDLRGSPNQSCLAISRETFLFHETILPKLRNLKFQHQFSQASGEFPKIFSAGNWGKSPAMGENPDRIFRVKRKGQQDPPHQSTDPLNSSNQDHFLLKLLN